MDYIDLERAQIENRSFYNLVNTVIGPRAVAWVSTIGQLPQHEGQQVPDNLAPFSYFSITGFPGYVDFSPTAAMSRGGRPKDTTLNIQKTGFFAINIFDKSMAEIMNETSAELETNVSEFDYAGIERMYHGDFPVPLVPQASVHLLCQTLSGDQVRHRGQSLYYADGTPISDSVMDFHTEAGAYTGSRIFGQVKRVLIKPAHYGDEANPVKMEGLELVGRWGGSRYVYTTNTFDLARPTIDPNKVQLATAAQMQRLGYQL